MKRFVCVPESLAKDGIPKEAEDLSEKSQLPINISADYDSISIISVPETFALESPFSVDSGYIFWLDVTDEYNVFSSDAYMICKSVDKEYKCLPKLRERHILRFRSRFFEKGNYTYQIWNKGAVLYEGEFEVI